MQLVHSGHIVFVKKAFQTGPQRLWGHFYQLFMLVTLISAFINHILFYWAGSTSNMQFLYEGAPTWWNDVKTEADL